ncbi:MAG: hypothetical protein JWN04_4362 [Myxococcaceae bacterium]|nr:hypothetical protein [Myxococcaceae bacterium]
MRLVCGTCSAVYEAPREGELCCSACSARPLLAGHVHGSARPRSSQLPGERWFVRTERGQRGPFTAAQLSQQLAEGRLDWTSDVWREGLGGFRAARRDERLVLAVAQARGLAGATMRLDSVQSLLHSSDTRLESPRCDPHEQLDDELLDGGLLDQHASDLRELTPSFVDCTELAGERLGGSTRPAAHEASRSLVALPTLHSTPRSVSARSSVPPGAFARGFAPSARPLHQRGTPWLATLAFFVGAVVALGPERLGAVALALPRGLRVQVSSSPFEPLAASAALPESGASAPLAPERGSRQARVESQRVLGRASSEPARRPTTLAPPEVASRAVPATADVQAALERVGPQLRRCVASPQRGLALKLTLEGQTGSVQSLHITSPPLRPGELECVKETFVDFRVPPFVEPMWQLQQRYAW